MAEIFDLHPYLGQHPGKAARIVVDNPELLDAVMEAYFTGEVKLSSYAIWVADHVNRMAPSLLQPYVSRMVEFLPLLKISGQRRTSLHILLNKSFSEDEEGFMLDYCFKLLKQNTEPTAVMVHAMQHVFDFSMRFPDLQPELKEAILLAKPEQTAGFKSRASKLLKKLN